MCKLKLNSSDFSIKRWNILDNLQPNNFHHLNEKSKDSFVLQEKNYVMFFIVLLTPINKSQGSHHLRRSISLPLLANFLSTATVKAWQPPLIVWVQIIEKLRIHIYWVCHTTTLKNVTLYLHDLIASFSLTFASW